MDNRTEDYEPTILHRFQEWASLDPEVLTLSGSLMVFGLTMQMTGRFVPEYLSVLGAGSVVVGLYGTFKEILNAAYPYPGGALSDRFGSRFTLISFGLVTTLGFTLWGLAPWLGDVTLVGLTIPAWIWVFLGAVLVLAWKELGLGATFALVKDAVPPERLARGFASTEVFRRVGFLIGPLVASVVLATYTDFLDGFQVLLVIAVVLSLLATYGQLKGYRAAEEHGDLEEKPENQSAANPLENIFEDFTNLPSELKPLLLGDTLVRFANGMVYVFFVLVITRYHEVGWTFFEWKLSPASFFGFLLGVEMTVALISMVPAARLADRLGQKPVVTLGFFVYAVFPALLILAPAQPHVMIVLFAFSGLRFAGMPGHKALIVGPARADRGGRTTGVYYLIRNTLRTPAPAIGGVLYELSPTVAFTAATIVGLIGVLLFAVFGQRFQTTPG